MSFDYSAPTRRVGSRWAVIGFWLWAGAVALVVAAFILGSALADSLPVDMGIGSSVTFPVVAALIGIPVSTVGLAFAVTSLVKREPRRGLAVATTVFWFVTPVIVLIVGRTLAELAS
jgi:hypothetical protein